MHVWVGGTLHIDFYCGVAVTAVNPQLLYVVLMAERHRLARQRLIDLRGVGGTRNGGAGPNQEYRR